MIQMFFHVRRGTGLPQFAFLAPEHFVQLYLRSPYDQPWDVFSANASFRSIMMTDRCQIRDVCEVLGIPEHVTASVQTTSWSQSTELQELILSTQFPPLATES